MENTFLPIQLNVNLTHFPLNTYLLAYLAAVHNFE